MLKSFLPAKFAANEIRAVIATVTIASVVKTPNWRKWANKRWVRNERIRIAASAINPVYTAFWRCPIVASQILPWSFMSQPDGVGSKIGVMNILKLSLGTSGFGDWIKIVHAMCGTLIYDVPQNRQTSDFDHRFWTRRWLPCNSCAQTTSHNERPHPWILIPKLLI